jgi:hypothetical protein
MRQSIWVLATFALIAIPQLSFSGAESFSCRDKAGQLHVADNLMSLPEECRFQADTSNPKDPGKVNYVPAVTQTHQNHNEFNNAVRQEQLKAEQQQREVEGLISEASYLAESFESAVKKRKSAFRVKTYGYREEAIQADKEMQGARAGKKALIEKLAQVHLSSEQKSQIDSLLARIED